MYLFVCENYKEKGITEELVQCALDRFLDETGMDTCGLSREILRTEKGKPYFKDIPVGFSVSHTADIWVCLMNSGNDPVGVDIQSVREYRYEKIASRYYTEQEQQYVRDHGSEGFFDIWTCKEAYAKYTGRGLGEYLKGVSVMENSEVEFIDLEIRDGIIGTCCVKEKEELWIRMI